VRGFDQVSNFLVDEWLRDRRDVAWPGSASRSFSVITGDGSDHVPGVERLEERGVAHSR
jgi:hypothetical protein